MLDWYPQAEHGGYYYALIHNLYKDAGLEVTIIPANPGMAPSTAVTTGACDLGLETSDKITVARGEGLPLVSIMATMQHDPKAIMVHADSPVQSIPDLDGHTIAVAPGASWFLYIVAKYKLTKIREARMTQGVGNFVHDPNYIQECFITSEPYFCEREGAKVRTFLIQDTGCDPFRIVFTTDRFLNSNKAALRSFVSASVEGWKRYLQDSRETDEAIKKLNPQMTQGQLDFSRNALIQHHFIEGFSDKGEAAGQLDPERLAKQYQILRETNIIRKDYDFTKSYTTEFCGAPKR
jgi:NitT/TauT family transport system substrate-binding protein